MRSIARRVLRIPPIGWLAHKVAAPFRVLIHRSVDPRFDELERQVAALRTELDGLDRYVPVILSSIQAQNAASRSAARTHEELAGLVATTIERFEVLKRSTVAEARRAAGGHDEPVEARILDRAKVDASRQCLRLDLSPAAPARPDRLRVARTAGEGVDVVADVSDLPFEKESVAEIALGELVSTFDADELAGDLLPYWVSLLGEHGELSAVVGELDELANAYVAGRIDADGLRAAVFGTAESPPRVSTIGAAQLEALFAEAGLTGVRSVARAGSPFEVEVVGRKTTDQPG